MELKNKVEMHIKKDNLECSLICPSDASLGFLFDALTEMRAYVLEKMNKDSKEDKKE